MNRVFDAICAMSDGNYMAACGGLPVAGQPAEGVLLCIVYTLHDCDFLPDIKEMENLKLWNDHLKALRRKGLFPTPISARGKGKLRVNINAGVTLFGAAFSLKHEVLFAQVAAATGRSEPLVVLEKEQSIWGFLSSIVRSLFCLNGMKGSELCLPERRCSVGILNTGRLPWMAKHARKGNSQRRL